MTVLSYSLLHAVALLTVFLSVQVHALCEQGGISIIENSVIALFDGTPLTLTSFTCPTLRARATFKSHGHIARQDAIPVTVCQKLEVVLSVRGDYYSHFM